jgi:hypothetical protein
MKLVPTAAFLMIGLLGLASCASRYDAIPRYRPDIATRVVVYPANFVTEPSRELPPVPDKDGPLDDAGSEAFIQYDPRTDTYREYP